MTWADRLLARVGGGRLVAARPQVGYLVWELTPATIWTQLTGAVTGEFFYLIAYLQLLGASTASLGYLPMVVCLANVLQLPIVLWQKPADPLARLVTMSWWGRSLWLGTIFWPLLGRWLGWGMGPILAGLFACVLITHIACQVSNASFVSWTQQVIPAPLRGLLYGWRSVTSFLVLEVVLAITARCLHPHASSTQQLHELMVVLTGATLISLGGVLLLRRGPPLAHHEQLRVYAPLWPQLRASRALQRLVIWSCIMTAATSLSAVYQSVLFLQAGANASLMTTWQAWVQYPCQLLAMAAAAWLLPRLQSRPPLILSHLLMLAGEGTLLLLTHARLPWLLPLVLAGFGLYKGLWSVAMVARWQELFPMGDPRFYAVLLAVANAVALLVTWRLPALVHLLEQLHLPTGISAAWVLVAVGVALRLIALPLLLWPDGATPAVAGRSPPVVPMPPAPAATRSA